MKFLLDTNVISELRKPKHRADLRVRSWAGKQRPSDLYLSVITILEIELGIEKLDRRDGFQAGKLRAWLEDDVLSVFSRRILPVDVGVVRRAARLHVPDPRPERDALIAATALVHDLTVATRNARDFAELDVLLVDPWGGRAQ